MKKHLIGITFFCLLIGCSKDDLNWVAIPKRDYPCSCNNDIAANFYISEFKIGAFFSNSSDNKSRIYIDKLIELKKGDKHKIYIKTNEPDISVYVYFDLNGNSILSDEKELIFSGKTDSLSVLSFEYQIPIETKSGDSFLRLITRKYQDVDDPCAKSSHGENEDYLVKIN